MTELLNCPLCKKPPGTKVGPPAMARCITPGCDGTKLAAHSIAEWNAHAAPAPSYPVTARMQELLNFLDSIEGAGYGGMASFEIARMNVRDILIHGGAAHGNGNLITALERVIGHDPKTPGLSYDTVEQLLSSAAQAARELLEEVRGAAQASIIVTDEMVESGLAAWMICEAGPTRRIVRMILEGALSSVPSTDREGK